MDTRVLDPGLRRITMIDNVKDVLTYCSPYSSSENVVSSSKYRTLVFRTLLFMTGMLILSSWRSVLDSIIYLYFCKT